MTKEWIESIAQGRTGHEIQRRAIQNIYSIHVQKDLIRCNFIVPQSLSDKDGNWHVGAITTLLDIVGSTAIVTAVGNINVSVYFNISYFATTKISEEVEIEAKVLILGYRGKFSLNMVYIRSKVNGELIAVGKQWMFAFDPKRKSRL
ncbi:hypothetical protein MKW98_004242 [Papaver atlanticum]|uniref:Thioesterase domain-containing protein n=1 Tax=Papaver atlanticum TaxID=357466 RepID=A0AAD4XSI7_9MAGN|nr:hypothetical protein MKW98_004242 [Papaver atlanticum]